MAIVYEGAHYNKSNSGLLTPVDGEGMPFPRFERGAYTEHAFTANHGEIPFEYNVYESDNPVDDTPIVIIPGFIETQAAVEPVARHIAELGRHAITYPPLREQEKSERQSLQHRTDVFIHQSNVIHRVLESHSGQSGNNRFDLIGHSMGNVILLYVAYQELLRQPSGIDIRSGISDAGAGLHASSPLDAVWKIANNRRGVWGTLKEIPSVIKSTPNRDKLKDDSLKHLSDVERLAREGLFVFFHPRAQSKLKRLQQNTDFKYAALVPEHDLFPEKDIRRQSGHLIDDFVVIPGAYHTHGNTHPDTHAQWIRHTFDRLHDTSTKTA